MKKEDVIKILDEHMKDEQCKVFGIYHININDIWLWFSRYEITKDDFGTNLTLYFKPLFDEETFIAEILLNNIISIR